jgi:tetratricopeptide (TPR) repeat protein
MNAQANELLLYIGRMFELKPISPEAVPVALAKAERYRLLNEPWQAESICRDVLRIEPEHDLALVMLLLSLTDQFGKGVTAPQAREVLARIQGAYEHAYYAGIISERWAESLIRKGAPGVGVIAYENLREAMQHYERAEALRPEGNDDAILRWNTCARILMRNNDLRPRGEEAFEPALED